MNEPKRSWLVKTEPECFSIQHLAASRGKTTCWDGVRNYQARNFLVAMRTGERVLFYHSNADPPAVVGTAIVAREAYPDPTAWNPLNEHFDPKASADNPIWQMIDLKLEEIFTQPLGLDRLRTIPALAKMELLRKGSRLSVQPVTEPEFSTILELAHAGVRETQPTKRLPQAKMTPKKRVASDAVK